MKTLQFKCTLLSDVIINQKSATVGNNQTLDFIPGSNFLGIVAAKYNEFEKNGCAWDIFHSGKVRFGDAHPAYKNVRTLRIPASLYYPKLKKVTEECYVNHNIPDTMVESDEFKKKQLKQCRSGFYAFGNNIGQEVEVLKTFAIKSTYDREKRRSKDKQMYGYQSIDKGAEFFFEVDLTDDSDKFEKDIATALTGEKRIGRSRTAQYGLCQIEPATFEECKSQTATNGLVTIYADSRLIFLDENGNPTFRPSINQLGLGSGNICWEKSQIRTFQYSPWNIKRQCYDTDRCGIEKGSVFVIKDCNDSSFTSKYIGSYNNEGFGKVIYNPDFLESKSGENGMAKYVIKEKEKDEKQYSGELKGNPLLDYLAARKKEEETTLTIYKMVNDFVDKHSSKFQNENFASQWGTIRSIAMKYNTKEDLDSELFTKTTVKNGKTIPDAYLTHGVAKDKWEENGRIKVFKDFFYDKQLPDDKVQIAIINLAAEMAKKCRR